MPAPGGCPGLPGSGSLTSLRLSWRPKWRSTRCSSAALATASGWRRRARESASARGPRGCSAAPPVTPPGVCRMNSPTSGTDNDASGAVPYPQSTTQRCARRDTTPRYVPSGGVNIYGVFTAIGSSSLPCERLTTLATRESCPRGSRLRSCATEPDTRLKMIFDHTSRIERDPPRSPTGKGRPYEVTGHGAPAGAGVREGR